MSDLLAPPNGPVDLSAAVARIGGNRDLYQQIYRMFRVDAGSMVTELARLVAAGQRHEAQGIWHTLHGLGGTMGATALAAVARRGEAAMARAASDEDASLLTEMARAFAQACLLIEQAMPELAPAPDGRTDACP